jgi:hypothetical protein
MINESLIISIAIRALFFLMMFAHAEKHLAIADNLPWNGYQTRVFSSSIPELLAPAPKYHGSS